jgi:primosomal protein N'
MRAEVLVLRGSRPLAAEPSLYTYSVPAGLRDHIAAGQLAAVPFGERFLPGLVWALDAAEDVTAEIPADMDMEADATSAARVTARRALAAVLLEQPLLSAERRALAEWLADYYAAPLADAVRLLLPPGLTSGMRLLVQASETPKTIDALETPEGAEGTRSASEPREQDTLAPDEADALALIRGRGRVEQRALARGLGVRRAHAVLARLEARGAVVRVLDVPAAVVAGRRERVVSLAAQAEALDAWRSAARAELDELPMLPKRRAKWQTPGREERRAERLLRQLATLDVLARSAVDGGSQDELRRVWRVEELRRLTRVTEGALAELADAGLVRSVEIERRHDPQAGRVPTVASAPLALTEAQSAALSAIVAALPVETCAAPTGAAGAETCSARRVFLLHGITGGGCRAWEHGNCAGAGDRADAAGGGTVRGALSRACGAAAQRADARRAAERVAAHPRRRGGCGGRLALGTLRAAAAAGADRGGRRARDGLQAGAPADVSCARSGGAAGSAHRRGGGARQRHALGGELSACARR